jgi:hypothetical protein
MACKVKQNNLHKNVLKWAGECPETVKTNFTICVY